MSIPFPYFQVTVLGIYHVTNLWPHLHQGFGQGLRQAQVLQAVTQDAHLSLAADPG